MAYYGGRGDYYRGVGDPGIFSFIGHALGTVAKVGLGAGLGFLTGGPKGAIVGAAGAAGRATATGIQRETLAAGGSQSALTPALRQQHALALARGPGSMMIRPYMGGVPTGVPGEKQLFGPYVGRHRKLSHLQKFGVRKRPTMNVANVHALRRATRRLAGFAHLAKRVMIELNKLSTRHHYRPAAPARARGRRTPLLLQHGDYYEG